MDRQVLVLLAVHVVNEHPDLPRWNGEPFRALERPFGILRGPARGHGHHGLMYRPWALSSRAPCERPGCRSSGTKDRRRTSLSRRSDAALWPFSLRLSRRRIVLMN